MIWQSITACALLCALLAGQPADHVLADIIDDEIEKGPEPEEVEEVQPDPITVCTERLVPDTKRADKLRRTYLSHSVDTDPEFTLFVLAVMHVESRFDPKARSHANAVGLMQMTEVAVSDVVQYCGFGKIHIDRLHDPALNIRYGTCFLRLKLKETGGDLSRALILYNGGYRQLEKYDRGLPIASETANYVLQIKRSLALCKAPVPPTK